MPADLTLSDLIARFEKAEGPDRDLDRAFYEHVIRGRDEPSPYTVVCGDYTASLDAARSAAKRVLPGWWVSSGLCTNSGHASMGPDYNGPDRDRLSVEWPEERFDDGFHADLQPGDGKYRECYAILHCMLQALQALASVQTPDTLAQEEESHA